MALFQWCGPGSHLWYGMPRVCTIHWAVQQTKCGPLICFLVPRQDQDHLLDQIPGLTTPQTQSETHHEDTEITVEKTAPQHGHNQLHWKEPHHPWGTKFLYLYTPNPVPQNSMLGFVKISNLRLHIQNWLPNKVWFGLDLVLHFVTFPFIFLGKKYQQKSDTWDFSITSIMFRVVLNGETHT